jgi:hypothetical protein
MPNSKSAGSVQSAVASVSSHRLSGWVFGVFAAAFALMLTLGLFLVRHLTTTGDEPWYLLQAYTLLRWHSVNLAPAIHDHLVYAQFLGSVRDDHTWDYLGNGERVLVNLPGYAAAIAPFYALGGRPLVVAFQALVAALTGTLVFAEARRIFGSRLVAIFAWLAYVLPLPVLLYVGQIFPSTLASFATFLGFVLVRRWLPGATGCRLLGVAVAIGLVALILPWLHVKYALTALALVGLALATLWPRLRSSPLRERDRYLWLGTAAIVGIAALGFGLIALYSHHYFGTWAPANARQQPDYLHPDFTKVVQLYSDIFLGRESGLIPWVPLDLLAPIGLALLLWRRPREGRAILALLIAQLGAFVTAAVSFVVQGKALPARFTVECAPFFALCAAAVFAAGLGPLQAWLAAVGARLAGTRRVARLRFRPPSIHSAFTAARLGYLASGACAVLALVLLAVTAWFAAVGQREPALLYAAPSGTRLAEKYAHLLPVAWFAAFPPEQGNWITQGAIAFSQAGPAGHPVPALQGDTAFDAQPQPSLRQLTVIASTVPVLVPPGRYDATVVLACDPASPSTSAAHLVVFRGYDTHSPVVSATDVPARACAGPSRRIDAVVSFSSDGYDPMLFGAEYNGSCAVTVWSVTYAPAHP